MEKKWKSCPENWKIREKLKVRFSMGTAGPIWQFFLNVRNCPNKFFRERKIGKVARKIRDFCMNSNHNSGFERWISVILFLF
jgi:hypothetical protein